MPDRAFFIGNSVRRRKGRRRKRVGKGSLVFLFFVCGWIMFPPLPLGFQASEAAGAELKGQVVTFLRGREKGWGVWGREGPAPKKGGSKKGGVVFFFFFPSFGSAVIRYFQLKSEPSPTAWRARGWLQTLYFEQNLRASTFFFFSCKGKIDFPCHCFCFISKKRI